jgi:hypothetical protein
MAGCGPVDQRRESPNVARWYRVADIGVAEDDAGHPEAGA